MYIHFMAAANPGYNEQVYDEKRNVPTPFSHSAGNGENSKFKYAAVNIRIPSFLTSGLLTDPTDWILQQTETIHGRRRVQ